MEHLVSPALQAAIALEVQRQLDSKLSLQKEVRLMRPSEAWKVLGFPSYKALNYAYHSGLFRIGKEVLDRTKPGARRKTYLMNIPACLERLKEEGHQRRAV